VPHQRATHFRVGLVVIATVVTLVSAAFLLGLLKTGRSPKLYIVKFAGTVVGLRERASEVLYRGVRIGLVTRIEVDSDNPEWIMVQVEIDPDFNIKQGMEGYIIITDLTGIRDIELEGGARTDRNVPPGYEIPGRKTVLEKMGKMTQDLVSGSSSLLANLTDLTGEANRAHFASTIANIDEISTAALRIPDMALSSLDRLDAILEEARETLESAGNSVDETLSSTRELIENPDLVEVFKHAAETMEGLNEVTRSLAAAAGETELRGVLDETRGLIVELSGLTRDLRGMIRENRPDIQRILTNLRLSSDHLREITLTLRDSPSAIIRAAPPKERKRP
jgi:ABC-type transporter Mla subunit MlaD